VRDEQGNLTGFGTEQTSAPVAMRGGERQQLKKQLHRLLAYTPERWKHLKVKDFPTRTLTLPMLRGYLDLIAAQKNGFVPDLLIIDYAEIMATDAKDIRVSLFLLMEELRKLAKERDIAVVTVWQGTRESHKAWQLDFSHTSESYMAACTADCFLSFMRSAEEKPYKLARIWVNKNRNGVQDFGVVLTQNYEHGQFVLDSARYQPSYRELLEEFTAEAGAAEASK
jgi:hypothetical protein